MKKVTIEARKPSYKNTSSSADSRREHIGCEFSCALQKGWLQMVDLVMISPDLQKI